MSLILALIFVPAFPQTQAPTGSLVEVAPGARANFRDTPSANAPRRKAYVTPGDMLVAGPVEGGFTSVTFVANDGTPSSGWIETARLRPASARSGSWSGSWNFGNSTLEISVGRAPGKFHLVGQSSWGSHDPERVRNGGVHVGDIEGDLRTTGDRASYSDGSEDWNCRVEMRLLGPYLLVEDNDKCGGMNVTFHGIYRRWVKK